MTAVLHEGYVPVDSVAARVRILRAGLRLDQREAADRCGLTYGEWQGIEDGRAVRDLPRKLLAISRGLAVDGLPVSMDWLMWGYAPEDAPRIEFSRKDEPADQGRFSGADADDFLAAIPHQRQPAAVA